MTLLLLFQNNNRITSVKTSQDFESIENQTSKIQKKEYLNNVLDTPIPNVPFLPTRQIFKYLEDYDFINWLSAKIWPKENLSQLNIPTSFLQPRYAVPDIFDYDQDNSFTSWFEANIQPKQNLLQLFIQTSFLRPQYALPEIFDYDQDNAFLSWLISKIQLKESLVSVHIEPTSFLQPKYALPEIFDYDQDNAFVSLYLAKIQLKENLLQTIIPTNFLSPIVIPPQKIPDSGGPERRYLQTLRGVYRTSIKARIVSKLIFSDNLSVTSKLALVEYVLIRANVELPEPKTEIASTNISTNQTQIGVKSKRDSLDVRTDSNK